MTESANPWKTVRRQVVYQDRWLTLHVDEVIKPTGEPGTYTYIEGLPFVLVVAYDGRRICFVRQYRYDLRQMMVEVPGGCIDANEDALTAAKRELQEETGLAAVQWTRLGVIRNPNTGAVFLAEGVSDTGHDKMHEDGIAERVWLSLADSSDMVMDGRITDSKTLAALHLFEHFISQRHELEEE